MLSSTEVRSREGISRFHPPDLKIRSLDMFVAVVDLWEVSKPVFGLPNYVTFEFHCGQKIKFEMETLDLIQWTHPAACALLDLTPPPPPKSKEN